MRPVTEEVLADWERRAAENMARIAAKGEPRRRGRKQSAATKAKLKAIHLERERQREDAPDSPLRRARLAAGLSWPDLAAMACVSEASIARAESPTRHVEVAEFTWRRLARALGVRPEEIRWPDDDGAATAVE
jgi:ribosome-binding protein aMBF1 (putative translation factor)